jgi:hypothetical protein
MEKKTTKLGQQEKRRDVGQLRSGAIFIDRHCIFVLCEKIPLMCTLDDCPEANIHHTSLKLLV